MVTMGVRLDRWLNAVCLFKTRTQATDACAGGRIKVNGETAKAHRAVELEDRVEFRQGDWPRVVIVKGLREKPVSKVEARTLYEDQSPPRPKLDPIDRILQTPPATREKGKGRPSKRERRQIDRLRE